MQVNAYLKGTVALLNAQMHIVVGVTKTVTQLLRIAPIASQMSQP